MTFKEYQQQTASTVIYPKESSIVYCIVKLLSEAGEIADAFGKWIRKNNIIDINDLKTKRDRNDVHKVLGQIADEIGDVLWYCSQLSAELDFDLEYIARANVLKLQQRKKEGTLNRGKYTFLTDEEYKAVKEECLTEHLLIAEQILFGKHEYTEEDLKMSTQISQFCDDCHKPILEHHTAIKIEKNGKVINQYHRQCYINLLT